MMSPKMKMLGKLANRFGQQGVSRRLFIVHFTDLKHCIFMPCKNRRLFSASKITWRAWPRAPGLPMPWTPSRPMRTRLRWMLRYNGPRVRLHMHTQGEVVWTANLRPKSNSVLGDLGNKKGGGRGWLTHSREEIEWDKVGRTHFSDAMVTASDKRRGISEKRVLRGCF